MVSNLVLCLPRILGMPGMLMIIKHYVKYVEQDTNFSCASYDQFQIGGETYNFDELGCLDDNEERDSSKRNGQQNPGYTLINTNQNCGPQNNLFVYQIQVGQQHTVYESCYDETVSKTIWTRHILEPFPTRGGRAKGTFSESLTPGQFKKRAEKYTKVLLNFRFSNYNQWVFLTQRLRE